MVKNVLLPEVKAPFRLGIWLHHPPRTECFSELVLWKNIYHWFNNEIFKKRKITGHILTMQFFKFQFKLKIQFWFHIFWLYQLETMKRKFSATDIKSTMKISHWPLCLLTWKLNFTLTWTVLVERLVWCGKNQMEIKGK